MSKVMRPTSMERLLGAIAGEWESKRKIFEIPAEAIEGVFELEARSPGFDVMGKRVSLPVGPAAGPNTQIAQSLIAAYLCGGRVFELKTVQVLDRLEIEKPCIDTIDEGYNVEWSTELSLEDALAEYLRAWVVIHLLEQAFARGRSGELLFNMSVGYTLEGIQSERVDRFIDALTHPAGTPVWDATLAEARAAVESPAFARAFGPAAARRMAAAIGRIPVEPIHSVTLSTMHGCPPEEIERIARYLIEKKGLSTYVKLNPTLLGYDRVRSILDRTGWSEVHIEREAFEKDLQLSDALALIASLQATAAAKGLQFGLKLSNTLANSNDKGRLPGGEAYLSGRPLFPITSRLAAELARALDASPRGGVPFSFCAGVSALNAEECIRAGLGPLTAATDLLKPGGYLRLADVAEKAVAGLDVPHPARPDARALDALAEAALERREYHADWKEGRPAIPRGLPLFDCFAAPCVEACPVHQNVPAYIRALASGDATRAMEIVLADNPLPTITGLICDHACTKACCRDDYEGPVDIRGVKLACVRAAEVAPEAPVRRTGVGKTAVFGGGPAGLACAHYLAASGYPVVVFDRGDTPGGVVSSIVPRFRIAREDVARDVERIRALGARFQPAPAGRIDLTALKGEGFTSIVVAFGAPVERTLRVAGEGVRTVGALEFLAEAAKGSDAYAEYRNIVVVGGGFTSLDAVRVARRFAGGPRVRLVYRRTRRQMPAEQSEVEAAIEEGVELCELRLPERIEEGRVIARVMELGELDESGRRSPVATERTELMECDLVVVAIGEEPNRALLEELGVEVDRSGRPRFDPETLETAVESLYVAGDVARGPASIIRAAADGRRAATAILRKAGIEPAVAAGELEAPPSAAELPLASRGRLIASIPVAAGQSEARRRVGPDEVQREAERCLSCDAACLRCVEVCPNRANIALPVAHGASFTQSLQILHLDDLCNDCGACGFLCPYETNALPYKDKPTLFSSEAAFAASTNPGFCYLRTPVTSSGGAAGNGDGRRQAGFGQWSLLLRARGKSLRVEGPSGAAVGAAAAGYSPEEARDLERMYELAETVRTGHPYLLGGQGA